MPDGVSKEYVDAIVAASSQLDELHMLREEVRQLREAVHGRAAPMPQASAPSSGLVTTDYPQELYSWPYFIPTPIAGGMYLPISGGTMTGPLLLNTHPVPVDAGVLAFDTDTLRAYGLTCSPATLGSKFGTIAAAQAVYPFATSLSQTLDWAAIQSVLNTPNAPNGVSLFLPPGDIQISDPLVSGSKSVYIHGCGPLLTRLLLIKPVDLFQHGLTSQVYFATFMLKDLGLYSWTSGTGWAINIHQTSSSGVFLLDNVHFNAFSGATTWGGYVQAEGTTRSTFRDVFATGGEFGTGAGTQVGFQFNAPDNNNKSFGLYFVNSYIGAMQSAVVLSVTGPPGNSGSIEGVFFDTCGGRSVFGPWLHIAVPNSASVWWPPFMAFDKCNMQSGAQLIVCDSYSEVRISDCLFYVEAPSSGGSIGNYLDFSLVKRCSITDTTFVTFASANISYFIHIGPNSDSVAITECAFYADPATAGLSGGILVDAAATNVRTLNNTYATWLAGVPFEVDNSNGANGNSLELSTVTRTAIRTGHGPALQLIDAGATVANYISVQPTPTTFGPVIKASGSDTNVGLNIQTQGTGSLTLGQGAAGGPVLLNAAAGAIRTPTAANSWGVFSGLWLGWNYSGSTGEADLVCSYGGGSGGFRFYNAATSTSATPTLLSTIDSTGNLTATSFVVNPSGPTIRAGVGAATGTQPRGSLWLRTDGAIGTTLYVSQGAGTWNAVASV